MDHLVGPFFRLISRLFLCSCHRLTPYFVPSCCCAPSLFYHSYLYSSTMRCGFTSVLFITSSMIAFVSFSVDTHHIRYNRSLTVPSSCLSKLFFDIRSRYLSFSLEHRPAFSSQTRVAGGPRFQDRPPPPPESDSFLDPG